jgi:radical SAM protein with 4Fe4S-binding SPASM domain
MKSKELWDRLFYLRPLAAPPAIATGLYHYQRAQDDTFNRFHLRVEPDGSGMLLANATTAARLSPSGVIMAKALLEDKSEAELQSQLAARFRRLENEQWRQDLVRIRSVIDRLTPESGYPVMNLADAAFSPYEAQLMAPLEATVPLAPPEQLIPLLDRIWQVGIPHVTFLAGRDPQAADLVRAVERAEDLGMIAGVSGRATDLGQGRLLEELAQAGVDHITFLYAAPAAAHDVLCGEGDYQAANRLLTAVQTNEICPVAEIPLVEMTLPHLRQIVATLQAAGVVNFSFFAIAAGEEVSAEARGGALAAPALRQVATLVEELADELQVRFIWQPPVRYRPDLSLAKQVQNGPRCSGDAAVRIEPDGSVIPPRGPYRSAGNLLRDSWGQIWSHPAFQTYREQVETPTHCDVCPGLAICAVDCPAHEEGWSGE